MTMTNENLKFAMNVFGFDLVSSLINQLRLDKNEATGKLINSLNWKLVETLDHINLQVLGESYFKFIDEGRKPGKNPPYSKILEWTKAKGIPQNRAFDIAVNIGRFGVKPKQTLKQALLKSATNISELQGQLEEKYRLDIEAKLKEIINEIK